MRVVEGSEAPDENNQKNDNIIGEEDGFSS